MKKKVAIYIDNLNGGGAEKVLINYLKSFDYNTFEVTLYLIMYEGVYLTEIPSNVNVKYFFKKSILGNIFTRILRRLFSYWPYLYYLFFIKKCDVEIGFREGFSTDLMFYSPFDTKKITFLHTNIQTHHLWYLNKSKYIQKLNLLDTIICVSNSVKKSLLEVNLSLDEKCKVIYNPIDFNDVQAKLDEINPISLDDYKLRFVTIGRLDQWKNQKLLIESLASLKNILPNFILFIIGDGPENTNLKSLVVKLRLSKHIFFTGFVKNPLKYLNGCEYFLFSSKYEGLPTVIIESLYARKKILSTYCNGAEEILRNGKYGLLSNNSIEEYSKGILKLIDSDLNLAESWNSSDYSMSKQTELVKQIILEK